MTYKLINIKSSLLITKEGLYSLHKKFNCAGELSVENIDLNYDSYKQHLHSIGAPWGWDRRPKYLVDPEIFICAPQATLVSIR